MKKLFKDGPVLMDGGLETTLVFHEGIALNHFAAFELLNTTEGRRTLKKYYQNYLDIAGEYGMDFILDTPSWRANLDWAEKLGYSRAELEAINRDAIAFLQEIAAEQDAKTGKIVINGCIGPRGDGYKVGDIMRAEEARDYHGLQVGAFSAAGADMISAITMNYTAEGLGIALAAKEAGIPVVISFTTEMDGRLPSGELLKNAIEMVDAATGNYPEHFMINCAHPDHFMHVLQADQPWLRRIRGVRANASTKSHAELDEAVEVDMGDMAGLARNYQQLQRLLPNLSCYGGCCGTDHRHIGKIVEALFVGSSKN